MSIDELKSYLKGNILVNHNMYKGKRTKSVGFCFFEYKNDGLLLDYYNDYVSGVVTDDFVCVFKVDKRLLNKSEGGYAR